MTDSYPRSRRQCLRKEKSQWNVGQLMPHAVNNNRDICIHGKVTDPRMRLLDVVIFEVRLILDVFKICLKIEIKRSFRRNLGNRCLLTKSDKQLESKRGASCFDRYVWKNTYCSVPFQYINISKWSTILYAIDLILMFCICTTER